MLNKEHLQFFARGGVLRPRFVDTKQPELVTLAASLLAIVDDAAGTPRGELEEALVSLARGFRRPKIAHGLVKLVLDRLTFEAPDEAAETLRAELFALSAEVRARIASAQPSIEDGQAALALAVRGGLERDLDDVRRELYRDLPDERPLLAYERFGGPEALLQRYNLALAQGLLLYAQKVTLTVERAGTVELRRLLRWLKFCRLVADISREGSKEGALVLEVDGPAALFDGAKRYGLQLAMFLQAVPLLSSYTLKAEVRLQRRPAATLTLTDADPLESPLTSGLGHVPEEIEQTLAKLEEAGAWTFDRAPEPRPVGATGLAVPDVVARHAGRGLSVAIELFHAWHAGPLLRRLEELRLRPDAGLLLGVDRALTKDAKLSAAIEGAPQVFVFNAFPSARVLENALTRQLGS